MKIDKIEVLPNKVIQVRKVDNDGKYSRYSISPDTDMSNIIDSEVKEVALKEWTDEVVEVYKESIKPIPLTPLELKAKAISDSKSNGEPYNGSEAISFTQDDAAGMLQVQAAFNLGITETKIQFSNGTIFPIKAEDFVVFATWFAQKRNSFFI